MGVNIIMLILAAFFIRNGIDNLKGNIDSVHWYNRRRITEETRPKYGKLIGISTLIQSKNSPPETMLFSD